MHSKSFQGTEAMSLEPQRADLPRHHLDHVVSIVRIETQRLCVLLDVRLLNRSVEKCRQSTLTAAPVEVVCGFLRADC